MVSSHVISAIGEDHLSSPPSPDVTVFTVKENGLIMHIPSLFISLIRLARLRVQRAAVSNKWGTVYKGKEAIQLKIAPNPSILFVDALKRKCVFA
jgi:hypothetical protein